MPSFLPTLIILSAAAFAVLFILFRLYESRVEQPKKLEDEIVEALNGQKPNVVSVEPVRKAAVAMHYEGNKFVLVREFGKLPTKVYPLSDLLGLELLIDGRVLARVIRGGVHKMIDDTSPSGNEVNIRFILEDPNFPSYELSLWNPSDGGTSRAEGPRAAMNNARQWFYHVEAAFRHARLKPEASSAMVAAITPASYLPEPAPSPSPQVKPLPEEPSPPLETKPKPSPSPAQTKEGDVLNAPIIPYL